MGTTKLTSRQLETLRIIHEFSLTRGLPPSIGDLRKALGVSSDQAVIELLERLERRGLIERTPGQARALTLTKEGRLAIGAPVSQTSTRVSVAPSTGAPELNPHQQRIFKRLTDIDPKFARMYMGALRVLLDEGNPERIVQSAHSIRESTARLSDTGKTLLTQDEISAAKKGSSNARQLEKLFDPLGGVRCLDQTLYDTWNKEFHQFFVEVAHHGKHPSLDEYRAQLARYEEFLSSYVLPLQTEIYDRIDKHLATGPEDTALLEVKLLLSRNVESYRYFFRKADARWLGFLRRHNFLTANWEVADYLARISPQAADDVMAIIESMPTVQGDWPTRKGLIDAANKMPPMVAARLVRKLEREKWLRGREGDWLSYPLNDLLEIFIDNSMHEDALRLSHLLLGFQPPGPDSSGETRSQIGDHYYGETLKRFSKVPAAALAQYIRLLVTLLGWAILLERPEKSQDGSTIWRPAIEDHEQNWRHGDPKDLLVSATRVALERRIEYLKSAATQSLITELDSLLKWDPPYSIFRRLRLHVYRLHAGDFMLEIEKALIEEFDDWEVWHEYALLLAHALPSLSPATRSCYLQAVNGGPTGEKEENYIRHWKARKISVIREHLSQAELDVYKDLIPEAEQMAQPDFLSPHSSWRGPTSPRTENDLLGMPVMDVIQHLVTWEPTKDWDSPSREGLGRVLSAVVAKNGEPYSREAASFLDSRIRPVYLYHLLFGFREALKSNARMDWKGILILARTVVQRAQSGALPAFAPDTGDDDLETKWDSVYEEIASLLEAGLANRTDGLPFTSRDEIWPLIEFLCEHPDPTPEHEAQYGGDNMEPVTLSINTVRGRAFHALFAYIFWCDRHLKDGGHKSRIPDEAKRILESHLDVARDPSLTIRSVYGQYFPWLFVYDPEWTSGLIAQAFPADDRERRYAAWETYLSNAVFPEVYTALRAKYELAISELRKFKKERRYWADPIERLAHHMMITYAYRMGGDKDPLWSRFFRVADPKQRGMAVSFCGRVYIHRKEARSDEGFPDTNRLQEFWEWRLAASKDVDELREFGWWVAGGRFNDEWMLERLIETLHKTGGTIEAGFHVLAVLSACASRHPVLCASALLLIVKSRSADRLMLGHNENIEGILSSLYSSADAQAIELAGSAIDHLTKLGFERYREISKIRRRLPSDELAPSADTARN